MTDAPTSLRPDPPQTVAAIVLAAGTSERMEGIDKIWADLDGAPVIAHSISLFAAMPEVTDLVIVAPAEKHDALRSLAPETTARVQVVEGGARRQDSVASGLAAVSDADWVLVHDGARPLASRDLAVAVLEAARAQGAVVPGIAVHDAIKRVDRRGRVVASVDRSSLRAAQTPQGFAGPLLRRAHARVHANVSDDAAMIEAIGAPVHVIEGDPNNLKITTALDLEIARLLSARRRERRAG